MPYRHVLERIHGNVLWFAACLIPLGLLFVLAYGATNVLAAGRSPMTLAMDWEKSVPFVPNAIWAYVSIFLVFWFPLIVLEREGIAWLMKRYVVVTLTACGVFLAIPTAVGFERPDPNVLPSAFAFLHALDAPYNAAPSLHVAYAVLILGTCARALAGAARAATITWLVVLTASTWLTGQHQLADILAGALLGGLSSLGNGAGAGSDTGRMPVRHMRKYWRA